MKRSPCASTLLSRAWLGGGVPLHPPPLPPPSPTPPLRPARSTCAGSVRNNKIETNKTKQNNRQANHYCLCNVSMFYTVFTYTDWQTQIIQILTKQKQARQPSQPLLPIQRFNVYTTSTAVASAVRTQNGRSRSSRYHPAVIRFCRTIFIVQIQSRKHVLRMILAR